MSDESKANPNKAKAGETAPAPTFADLDRAKADHQALFALAEKDRRKAEVARDIYEARVKRLKDDRLPPETFAQAVADLPPPYAGDEDLARKLHASAYAVDALEKALNYNQPDRKV